MDPIIGPQPSATVPAAVSSTGIFGTKIPATAAFLVGLLLFLLPFAEIRCNGTALANNTGLGIALGSEWKVAASNDNLFGNNFGNQTTNENKFQKHEKNIFAIAAIILGVLGLLIAFLLPAGGGKLNLGIGILSAVSLIAMLIDLKSDAKSDNSLKSSDIGFNTGGTITVDGTGWFYLTIILFVLGGIFSYLRVKNKLPT
jgi:hypothetical protein